MKALSKNIYFVLILLFGSSCAGTHKMPAGLESVPKNYSASVRLENILETSDFVSSQLNEVLVKGVLDNLDIKAAKARLDKAKNIAVISRSKRIPTLDLNVRANYAYSDGVQTQDDIFGGFVSSYEVDLWGRVRAAHLASKMDVGKSSEDLKTALVSSTSAIAKTYFELQAKIKITDLLKRQLKVNQEYKEVMEERFFAGAATALDLLQQEQAVAKIKSSIPLSVREEQLLRHVLSVLLGLHASSDMHLMPEENLPFDVSLPDTGFPLELLHNRPDVKSAYFNLQKYLWELTSTKLSRLPQITISPSGGFGFDDFNKFLATITGNAVLPLFRSGAKNAEVEAARANVEQFSAIYRQAVLNAVKDTEDVMVKINTQKDYLKALNKEFEFAEATYREARYRYLNGSAEYNLVVAKLLTLQTLEQTNIRAQKDLCLLYVDFYRSIGEFLTPELEKLWKDTK